MTTSLESTQAAIAAECDRIKALLLEKNARYGNSAAQPANVFSCAAPLNQIAVRCDDKFKRIKNMGGLEKILQSMAPDGEDTVQDLIGYLILARVVAGTSSVERVQKTIAMMRFYDAPEWIRALSRHGGDEDWVIIMPKGMDSSDLAQFEGGLNMTEDHYLDDGRCIVISAHA